MSKLDEKLMKASGKSRKPEPESSGRSLDDKLKSSGSRNTTISIIVGSLVSLVVIAFLMWLFLVKGHVIVVSPDKAAPTSSLSLNGGMGFVIEDRVYRFSGIVEVTVDAVKFEPKTIAIGGQSPSMIEVKLEPSPAVLNFSISPSNEDALWSIDGLPEHVGGHLQKSVKPGTYELRVESPYHQPKTFTKTFESEVEYSEVLDLAPVEGKVKIDSSPRGAEVYLDGNMIGKTPLSGYDITGGAYSVEIVRNGYESVTEEVQVTFEEPNVERRYLLSPVKATLNVTADPADGYLLINGKKAGLGKNRVVANKTHSILYERGGYLTYKGKAKVGESQTKNVAIELQPEYGDVLIETKPAAAIYIDGKLAGEGTYKGNLQAFNYKVELVKEGYRTVTRYFKPTQAKLSKVEVAMLTEFEARKLEGRQLYAETIGIKFAKAVGSNFKIGSKPNDYGRRANESQVEVSFTKPFFISTHEVTEKQYSEFSGQGMTGNYPITNVSWNEAALFTNWLSQKEGLKPVYRVSGNRVTGFDPNANGYRLPTEAEWEWTSRMSKRSTPMLFDWGNSKIVPEKSGNFGDNSIKGQQVFTIADHNDGYAGAAPVGSFDANRFGVYDMAGNVSEWVHDYFSFMAPTNPQVDYMGPSRGTSHVWKGGNFKTGKVANLRAAYRESGTEGKDTIGFRIARYDF